MEMQTDIEVLKTEVHGLYRAVTDVATKIDMLLAMQVQLVRLQEQHDTTRQALDRAFDALRTVRTKADTTDSRLHAYIAFVRGGALVGAILFGAAQWYMLQQLSTLQEVAKHSNKVNMRLTLVEKQLWPNK